MSARVFRESVVCGTIDEGEVSTQNVSSKVLLDGSSYRVQDEEWWRCLAKGLTFVSWLSGDTPSSPYTQTKTSDLE